jgi:diguanylate cyclase (GGDEF)-like protein
VTTRPAPDTDTLAGRIRLALLTVTMLAILVVTLGASAIGYHFLRAQMNANLRSLASVTAVQGQAAVLFRDRGAAQEVLRALPREGGIVAAELLDASGAVLARVSESQPTLASTLTRALARETVVHDIVLDGNRIGSVRLETDGEPIARGLLGLVAFDLFGVLLIGAAVTAIARRLTRHITQPLTELEAVIGSVREKRDFRRRAAPCGIAEIDALRTDFHALLDEIQRRDRDLSRTNAALQRLAFRDALTGLPNRAMFERALLDALGALAQDGARAGLLYFDLDSFKAVNDALGHPAGDALLRGIAARLRDALPAHAVPARIGGDEFVALVAPVDSAQQMDALSAELQRSLQAPMRIGAHLFHPGISVGVAVSQEGATDGDGLIQLADRAMYSAKNQRKVAGARTRWEPFPGPGAGAPGPRDATAGRAIRAVAMPHSRTARQAPTIDVLTLDGDEE